MSSIRSMARRKKRENEKLQKAINHAVRRFPAADAENLAARINVRVNQLEEWANKNIDAIWDDASVQMNEILHQAEDYICAVHIIASLRALEIAFGDLKTISKRMNKFVESFNDAIQYTDKLGTKEALRTISDKYDLDPIEFDDFDINQLWEHESRVAKAKETMREKIKNEQEGKEASA